MRVLAPVAYGLGLLLPAFAIIFLISLLDGQVSEAIAEPASIPPAQLQTSFAFTRSTATITSTIRGISDTTFGFSVTELGRASEAIVTARTGDLSYASGLAEDPAAGDGQLLPAGQSVAIAGQDLRGLRFIEDTVTDTIVSVTLYRFPGN